MTYQTRRLEQVRPSQLEIMHRADLVAAIRIVRAMQLEILRKAAESNDRSANENDQAGSSGGLLLGALLAAMGFEALADHPLEQAAGLGAGAYRAYLGISA